MNEKPIHDPALIDLLVDDELSPTERRRLLERLNAQPDGWKCVAIAFLDAQTLARDLRTLSNETADTPCVPLESSQVSANNERAGRWPRVFQFALTACVCLLIGSFGTLAWNSRMPESDRPTAVAMDPADVVMTDVLNSIAILDRNSTSGSPNQPRKTCLTEIVDNEFVSIYETPDLLPPMILESLVMAGHDIEVRQPNVGQPTPVNRIVVKKTPNLF